MSDNKQQNLERLLNTISEPEVLSKLLATKPEIPNLSRIASIPLTLGLYESAGLIIDTYGIRNTRTFTKLSQLAEKLPEWFVERHLLPIKDQIAKKYPVKNWLETKLGKRLQKYL